MLVAGMFPVFPMFSVPFVALFPSDPLLWSMPSVLLSSAFLFIRSKGVCPVASPFTSPWQFLADLHSFAVFLYTFRDWQKLDAVYKKLSLSRSDVFRKAEALVRQGLLLKRQEGGVNYYRVPSRRITIAGFGVIELDDSAPVMHIYIDEWGNFLRRVRRNDVEVVWVGDHD